MPLTFVGNTTTIRMAEQSAGVADFEIPAMDVNVGTKPRGTFWRRNPVPACNCDLGFLCGSKWVKRSNGTKPYWIDPDAPTKTPACPTGTQYPPAHPAIYGYNTYYRNPKVEGEEEEEEEGEEGKPGKKGAGKAYSLVDKVLVPERKGEYILSFRWDCEQTAQVWNSCADVVVV